MKLTKAMRNAKPGDVVTITDIHPEDAYYVDLPAMKGKKFKLGSLDHKEYVDKGYVAHGLIVLEEFIDSDGKKFYSGRQMEMYAYRFK